MVPSLVPSSMMVHSMGSATESKITSFQLVELASIISLPSYLVKSLPKSTPFFKHEMTLRASSSKRTAHRAIQPDMSEMPSWPFGGIGWLLLEGQSITRQGVQTLQSVTFGSLPMSKVLKISKGMSPLFMHKNFNIISDKLRQLQCSTLDELKNAITLAIQEITPEMVQNVFKTLRVCLICISCL